MDPLLAAHHLPLLAQRAMRAAVVAGIARGRMSPRSVVDEALVRFERAVGALAPDGVRPALLFSERDRIVRELRGFIDGKVAARLAALRRRDVIAVGASAAPFDVIVRNRSGSAFGVVLRRLPADFARLEVLQRIHAAGRAYDKTPLCGVLVYDFVTGSARLVRGARAVTRAA
jgi:hypothetical protein